MASSENQKQAKDICEACGATVAEGRDGCQKLFDEVIAREFGDYRYGRVHRLTVDVYSLQHPEPYMRSGKSFAAHLTGICAALEHENSSEINRVVQQWLSSNPPIHKPERLPVERGELTIVYVRAAADAAEHQKRVWAWARSVWEAWSDHHELAGQLIDEATGRSGGR